MGFAGAQPILRVRATSWSAPANEPRGKLGTDRRPSPSSIRNAVPTFLSAKILKPLLTIEIPSAKDTVHEGVMFCDVVPHLATEFEEADRFQIAFIGVVLSCGNHESGHSQVVFRLMLLAAPHEVEGFGEVSIDLVVQLGHPPLVSILDRVRRLVDNRGHIEKGGGRDTGPYDKVI